MRRPGPLHWLGAVVVLAAVLRFTDLGTQSFWADESYSVHAISGSFSELVHKVRFTESTPPVYYVLAWLWRQVFGLGEAGVRSLSALFGTALIPLVYAIARRVATQRVALVAALLAATSPELVWMSQEARSYALMILLGTASVLAFMVACERPTRRTLLVWSVVAAGALASHYFTAFLIGPELCWLVYRLRGRAAAAVVLPIAVGGALLPLALYQRGHTAFMAKGDQSLALRIFAAPKIFLVGQSASEFDYWLIVGVMVAVVVVGLALAFFEPARERLLPVAAMAAAAIGLPIVLAIVGIDYVNARNLLCGWPLVLILVAAGLAGRGVHRAAPAAAALLAVAGLAVTIAIDTTTRLQRDDWRGAAADLRATTGPGAVLLLDPNGGGPPLSLYLRIAPLPRSGARVRDLEVVSVIRGRTYAYFTPPKPFRLVRTTSSPSLRITRYEAPVPQRVTPASLGVRAKRLGVAPPEPVRRT